MSEPTPTSITISTTPSDPPSTILSLLRTNLLSVFNERSAPARQAAIAQAYHPSISWFESDGAILTGHEALDKRASELLASSPGFVFTPDGEGVVVQNLGMLNWNFGPEGKEDLVKGVDFIVVEGGVVKVMWTKVTKVPGE